MAAPSFAAAMGAPQATGVVRLLSLCVLVNGLVATSAALLQRSFRQDQWMVADQVNVWVGAGVSVALAVGGLGAWSLAVGRLSGSVLAALVLVHFRRRAPVPIALVIAAMSAVSGLAAGPATLAAVSVAIDPAPFRGCCRCRSRPSSPPHRCCATRPTAAGRCR